MRLCYVLILQCGLVKAQFPLFNFGDVMLGNGDSKKVKKPTTKGEKKKSSKASGSLFDLIGMGVGGQAKPRHFQDTNVTSDSTAKAVHPGILSLFRPAYSTDSIRKKSKRMKSPSGSTNGDSGFSALLSMLNSTTTGSSDKKKARKHNSSSDSYKASKRSSSKKESKSKKSKKGGRRSFNTSMSIAPSAVAFDSPSSGTMPPAPVIQGTQRPTSVPIALSSSPPVAQPTVTQAPIAPVFAVPVDPARPQGVIQQTQQPTATPVVVATSAPVATSTTAPTESPSIAPVPSTTTRSCSPTTGSCVETVAELEAAVAASTGGDTIAVCATTDPIVTQAAINIALSDMKICCLGETTTRTCMIRSAGSGNNMNVLGSSIRLQDLTFENGFSENSVGGNVAVVGSGDHVIDKCEFRNGEATDTGGNLFVRTDGTLTIVNSTFAGGRAGNSGGSLFVLNARELSIADSTFENNTVSVQDSSGGGLFSSLENPNVTYSQQIDIQRTTFTENTADLGGGFFVTQLGAMPRFQILQSTFTENTARSAGASGAIADSLDNLDFRMEFSISSGNTARICDQILGFYDNSTAPECLDIGANFP